MKLGEESIEEMLRFFLLNRKVCLAVTNAYYWNLLDFNWNPLFYLQFNAFLFSLCHHIFVATTAINLMTILPDQSPDIISNCACGWRGFFFGIKNRTIPTNIPNICVISNESMGVNVTQLISIYTFSVTISFIFFPNTHNKTVSLLSLKWSALCCRRMHVQSNRHLWQSHLVCFQWSARWPVWWVACKTSRTWCIRENDCKYVHSTYASVSRDALDCWLHSSSRA